MNDPSTCGALTGDEPGASRREVVGTAFTMAAAARAAWVGSVGMAAGSPGRIGAV